MRRRMLLKGLGLASAAGIGVSYLYFQDPNVSKTALNDYEDGYKHYQKAENPSEENRLEKYRMAANFFKKAYHEEKSEAVAQLYYGAYINSSKKHTMINTNSYRFCNEHNVCWDWPITSIEAQMPVLDPSIIAEGPPFQDDQYQTKFEGVNIKHLDVPIIELESEEVEEIYNDVSCYHTGESVPSNNTNKQLIIDRYREGTYYLSDDHPYTSPLNYVNSAKFHSKIGDNLFAHLELRASMDNGSTVRDLFHQAYRGALPLENDIVCTITRSAWKHLDFLYQAILERREVYNSEYQNTDTDANLMEVRNLENEANNHPVASHEIIESIFSS
ncbi:MAG: hypothetical protein U5K37_07285 [Natrialbaceae archaeon]|nr:hypothetical protein [Natrialbaceae archaeon]